MTKAAVLDWIRRVKIVPVVRANSAESAVNMARALIAGGIDVLEITMTVPGALEVIRELSATSDALVGAGTVLSSKVAADCIELGARFIVCPALNLDTIKTCNSLDVVIAPGALTPTEIITAYHAGGDVVKVFPCDAVGGPKYLRSIKGPFPQVPLMPTGGVDLETIIPYLESGAVAVGAGTSLCNPNLTYDELVAIARKFIDKANSFST